MSVTAVHTADQTKVRRYAVVKLLSKRWRIPIGARLKGQKLEPEGPKQRWGSQPPTRGFRAFKALCAAFVAFKECLTLATSIHPKHGRMQMTK